MVFAGVSRIRMSSMLCVEGVVISAASLFSSVLSVDLYLTFFVSFFVEEDKGERGGGGEGGGEFEDE